MATGGVGHAIGTRPQQARHPQRISATGAICTNVVGAQLQRGTGSTPLRINSPWPRPHWLGSPRTPTGCARPPPQAALARRNLVLQRMYVCGMIDSSQLASTSAAPLDLATRPATANTRHGHPAVCQHQRATARQPQHYPGCTPVPTHLSTCEHVAVSGHARPIDCRDRQLQWGHTRHLEQFTNDRPEPNPTFQRQLAQAIHLFGRHATGETWASNAAR